MVGGEFIVHGSGQNLRRHLGFAVRRKVAVVFVLSLSLRESSRPRWLKAVSSSRGRQLLVVARDSAAICSPSLLKLFQSVDCHVTIKV